MDAVVQNGFITIAISDNGIGIPEEKHEKIFVPYFTTKSTGTGLGLAIVKHVMEAHKEKMYVESTEGIGSEFSFTLQKSKSTG